MARFIRNVYYFNFSRLSPKCCGSHVCWVLHLSAPQVDRIGVSGPSFQFCTYSSSGGRISNLEGTYICDENMPRKELALQQALARVTGSFGKGSVMCLNHSVFRKNIPVISTGSFALDMALGAGGLPKGRIVEIYGPEASGKTTLALHVIAEAQKRGGCLEPQFGMVALIVILSTVFIGYCVYVDAEHALDPALAEAIGVDTQNLLLSQPECGEQALSLVNTFIGNGSVDVVVVDSVAALVPQRELDGEMGDANMPLQARLMNQALRKLQVSLAFSETILIFINQVRTKPSDFKGLGGRTEVTCGGNALKFYAAVRLHIKRTGLIRRGDQIIGSQVRVEVVKNKLTTPFIAMESEFELEFGKGIRQEAKIMDLALKHKLVTKAGPYYVFNNRMFNGKDSLKQFLSGNNVAFEGLVMKLREKLFGPVRGKEPNEVTCNEDSSKEI